MIIFGAFLVAADYTVQTNHIPKVDLKPEPRIERNVIYYDIIEIGQDGIRSFTKDSVVYYDEVKLIKK